MFLLKRGLVLCLLLALGTGCDDGEIGDVYNVNENWDFIKAKAEYDKQVQEATINEDWAKVDEINDAWRRIRDAEGW